MARGGGDSSPLIRLAWGASKASLMLRLDVEWQRLLLKFMDTFNCGERRWKSVHDSGGWGKSSGSVWVQNLHDIGHYLYGFLDRIVDGKNPNTFLV
jgi:hypothetical protein